MTIQQQQVDEVQVAHDRAHFYDGLGNLTDKQAGMLVRLVRDEGVSGLVDAILEARKQVGR